MSAFKSLYGGQFTLSTQLMKPNYLILMAEMASLKLGHLVQERGILPINRLHRYVHRYVHLAFLIYSQSCLGVLIFCKATKVSCKDKKASCLFVFKNYCLNILESEGLALAFKLRGFIIVFSRRTTGFQRRAKLFKLNFFIRKTFP